MGKAKILIIGATAACVVLATAAILAEDAARSVFGDDTPPPPEYACHAGAYRMADGRTVVITPLGDGLRYRLETGEAGKLRRTDGGHWTGTEGWTDAGPESAKASIGECGAASIGFALGTARPVPAERQRFAAREVGFVSAGTRLA